MPHKELKIDWLYQLKKKILLSILCVLISSILVTMVFISMKLRSAMVEDSRAKTAEMAGTIDANLHHLMMLRSPGVLQDTLEKMVAESDSVTRAFILNNDSRIAYSSDKSEIGKILDRYENVACRDCHVTDGDTIDTRAIVLDVGGEIQRNVSLIYNEPDCHECHAPDERISGKLVIDRSLASVEDLITTIEMILFGAALVCLVILVPLFSRLLSRGIDKYILEIFTRNEELKLLYSMVGRLSKTLDMDVLKEIVIEIFRDILAADEVELILPRGDHDYSSSAWSQANGLVDRKKIFPDDPEAPVLQRWLAGELNATEVAADSRMIAMPIAKDSTKLALIVARKDDGAFDKTRLNLSEIISSHIEVAFENARLYYLAITDELTRTYTKRHFRFCIGNQFEDFSNFGNKFALLMMDLDHFKVVNDNHGHVVGDNVLQRLGELIHHSIREKDLAFRYGGEEFAIILPGTDTKGAEYVAERIRLNIAGEYFEPGEIDLRLTISIGVSTCPGVSSIRDLIVAADQALYAAKRQGRNQVVVSGTARQSDS